MRLEENRRGREGKGRRGKGRERRQEVVGKERGKKGMEEKRKRSRAGKRSQREMKQRDPTETFSIKKRRRKRIFDALTCSSCKVCTAMQL